MNAPAQQKQDNRNKGPSNKAVYERAKRMARAETGKMMAPIAKLLGVPVDNPQQLEVALQKALAAKEAGMPENEKTATKMAELEARAKKAEEETRKMRVAYNKAEEARKAEVMKREDLETEHAVEKAAMSCGMQDLTYGLHLFREHALSDGQHKDDPKAYFESIKAEKRFAHFFGSEAIMASPPSAEKVKTDLKKSTAGGDLPPQGQPDPAKPGTKTEEEVDVLAETQDDKGRTVRKMDSRAFANYAGSKYGFRPGAG